MSPLCNSEASASRIAYRFGAEAGGGGAGTAGPVIGGGVGAVAVAGAVVAGAAPCAGAAAGAAAGAVWTAVGAAAHAAVRSEPDSPDAFAMPATSGLASPVAISTSSHQVVSECGCSMTFGTTA